MAESILILNGPNLNMVGTREPEIYGHETLADVEASCLEIANEQGFELSFKQSNHEGEMVDIIQQAISTQRAIVINPAAYSHTSIAILDALKMFPGPVMEIHISNIHQREDFRHFSFVSQRADGVIAGCGMQGYRFALQRAIALCSA